MDPAPAPAPASHRSRGWIIAAAAIAVAAGAAVVERRAVTGWAAAHLLARAGWEPSELTVAAIGGDGAVLTGLRFGTAPAISAERIEIRYRPGDLIQRRLAAVDISGLRIGAGSDGDAPDWQAVAAGFRRDGGGRPDTAGWSIEAIRVSGGEIAVGGLGPDAAGSATDPQPATPPGLSPDAAPAPVRFDGTARLGADGRLTGTGTAAIAGARLDFGDGVTLDLASRWQVTAEPTRLTAIATGPVAAVVTIDDVAVDVAVADSPTPAALTLDRAAGAPLQVRAPAARIGIAGATFDLADPSVAVTLDEAVAVTVAATGASIAGAPAWLPPLALAARIVPGSGRHDLTGTLTGPTGAIAVAFAGGFDREESLWELDLETRAADQPVGTAGERLTLSGAWRFTRSGGGFTATPTAAVAASLDGILADGPVRIEADPQAAPALTITRTTGGLPLTAVQIGQLRVGAGATLVCRGIAAVLAATTPDSDERQLSVSILRFQAEGVEPWLADLATGELGGEGTVAGGVINVSADIRFGKGVAASATVRHDVAAGAGHADLRFQPVLFRPGGRQPGDLYPPLRPVIADAAGKLGLNGRIAWSGTTLSPLLVARAEDLSFKAEGIAVAGVNGEVRFDRLLPPGTPPGQTLTIASMDPGVPLRDVRVRFHLDGRGEPAVESIDFQYLGGTVATEAIKIDGRTGRIETIIRLTEVDLQALVALGELDDLSATGRISGSVPLQLEAGRLAVTGGRLESAGPGVVSYRPATPPAALAGAGESGDMMLQALKNFQFSTLSLTVDGRSGEGWAAVARIDGHNPDLLGGQPFAFNINLTGDIEETIRAALLGAGIATRLEQRLQQQQGATKR